MDSSICFIIPPPFCLRPEASERGSRRRFDAEAAGSRAGERRTEEEAGGAGGAAGPAGGQGSESEGRNNR